MHFKAPLSFVKSVKKRPETFEACLFKSNMADVICRCFLAFASTKETVLMLLPPKFSPRYSCRHFL